MTDTPTHVIAIVAAQSGRAVDRDSHLLEDLGLDSLDRIDLAMRIEDGFGIDIPDVDVDRAELATVGGLIDYVERRLKVGAQ